MNSPAVAQLKEPVRQQLRQLCVLVIGEDLRVDNHWHCGVAGRLVDVVRCDSIAVKKGVAAAETKLFSVEHHGFQCKRDPETEAVVAAAAEVIPEVGKRKGKERKGKERKGKGEEKRASSSSRSDNMTKHYSACPCTCLCVHVCMCMCVALPVSGCANV